MTEKYLVNCAHGNNDAEKATIAFILAFTSSKTNETAVGTLLPLVFRF